MTLFFTFLTVAFSIHITKGQYGGYQIPIGIGVGSSNEANFPTLNSQHTFSMIEKQMSHAPKIAPTPVRSEKTYASLPAWNSKDVEHVSITGPKKSKGFSPVLPPSNEIYLHPPDVAPRIYGINNERTTPIPALKSTYNLPSTPILDYPKSSKLAFSIRNLGQNPDIPGFGTKSYTFRPLPASQVELPASSKPIPLPDLGHLPSAIEKKTGLESNVYFTNEKSISETSQNNVQTMPIPLPSLAPSPIPETVQEQNYQPPPSSTSASTSTTELSTTNSPSTPNNEPSTEISFSQSSPIYGQSEPGKPPLSIVVPSPTEIKRVEVNGSHDYQDETELSTSPTSRTSTESALSPGYGSTSLEKKEPVGQGRSPPGLVAISSGPPIPLPVPSPAPSPVPTPENVGYSAEPPSPHIGYSSENLETDATTTESVPLALTSSTQPVPVPPKANIYGKSTPNDENKEEYGSTASARKEEASKQVSVQPAQTYNEYGDETEATEDIKSVTELEKIIHTTESSTQLIDDGYSIVTNKLPIVSPPPQRFIPAIKPVPPARQQNEANLGLGRGSSALPSRIISKTTGFNNGPAYQQNAQFPFQPSQLMQPVPLPQQQTNSFVPQFLPHSIPIPNYQPQFSQHGSYSGNQIASTNTGSYGQKAISEQSCCITVELQQPNWNSNAGCCNGNWIGNSGGLCFPINYNSCTPPPAQREYKCDPSYCQEQEILLKFEVECQPNCSPCTPQVGSYQSNCCCPQQQYNGFCGKYKKRTIRQAQLQKLLCRM